MKMPNPPEGYHALTPGLSVHDAVAAPEFYRKTCGTTEVYRFATTNGMIAHGEIRVGDSVLMVRNERPQWETPTWSRGKQIMEDLTS